MKKINLATFLANSQSNRKDIVPSLGVQSRSGESIALALRLFPEQSRNIKEVSPGIKGEKETLGLIPSLEGAGKAIGPKSVPGFPERQFSDCH